MNFNLIYKWDNIGISTKIVIIILIIMSIISLFIIIERLILFFISKKASIKYISQVQNLFESKNYEEILILSEKFKSGYLSYIIAEGLREFLISQKEYEESGGGFNLIEITESAVVRGIERQILKLRKRISNLASIGTTSPFIGLFGTLVGIMNAFKSIESADSASFPVVSGDIAEALITTALGILVAIPSTMAFNYFVNKIEEFTVEMNQSKSELIGFLTKEVSKKYINNTYNDPTVHPIK